jgi:hypothetical protein
MSFSFMSSCKLREEDVIPSLILAGLIVGRWWIVPIAMVAWPALLIGTGIDSGIRVIAAGSLIPVPNVALGVALRRGARHLWNRRGVDSQH